MKLEKTPISDLYVLNRKIVKDPRGSFSRLFGEDDIDKAFDKAMFEGAKAEKDAKGI